MGKYLGHIKFTPFGKGSTYTAAHIDTAYLTLQHRGKLENDVTSGLFPSNFAPNMGLPESRIAFSDMVGHVHGPLSRIAQGSLSTHNLATASAYGENVARVVTPSPATLMLAGRSGPIVVAVLLTPTKGFIDFAATSASGECFPLGTVPSVLAVANIQGLITNGTPVKVIVRSVTNTGFSYVVAIGQSAVTGANILIDYIAVGSAGGYISPTHVGAGNLEG